MKGNISNKKCMRKRQLHFKIHLWTICYFARIIPSRSPGAHHMEPPCPLISWVNPFPRRFINRTTFFCNAWIAWMRLLPAVWSKTILLSFLYFHWLFPLLAREISSGNCSIYKSTRKRVDSNGLYKRWRLHLIGSCVHFVKYERRVPLLSSHALSLRKDSF